MQAMRFTRDAGTVVVVGQYTDHGVTSFNPHLDLNKKHLDVRGCWGSEFSHFYRSRSDRCAKTGCVVGNETGFVWIE